MKILRILFALVLCNQIFAQETFPVNGVAENFKPIYAFTNANIIISPEMKFSNSTLLIQGDKILKVDSAIDIPKGSIIYNLKGDYIYPSFIDLYSDYGLPKAKKGDYNYRPQYKSKKIGAYHWNEAIHPEINSSEKFSSNEKTAKLYLSNGFGAVLSHIQDGILRGTGTFVALSKKSDHENILIKNGASFYSFKKGVSKQKNPTSLMGSIALLKQTLLDVEWYKTKKNQTNLSYDALINQKKLPQIFDLKHELDYSRIYKIADEFELDFIVKGNGKEFLQINEISNAEFSLIIPINFPSPYNVNNPETADWISLQKLKNWEYGPYNPYILAQNQNKFCITSAELKDPKDFLKNLRIAIKKGLSKKDALAALTTTTASLIGANDIIGALKPGMLANFIITSGDIFEDAEIYENWNLGEKYIINKKQNTDIRGYYTFNSDEFKNKPIAIMGDLSKPKTIFYELDSNAIITNLTEKNVNLSDNKGEFRAIGKFSNGVISGRYQNKEGEYYDFNMVLDSLLQEDLNGKNSKQETD